MNPVRSLWAVMVLAVTAGAEESSSAAIVREDKMWRLVRVEEDVAGNVERWRGAGFPAAEIEAMAQRLATLWNVTPPRNFGWLSTETAEAVREVDRDFEKRMRAARLWEETGLSTLRPESSRTVDRRWHRAVLRALDYDEVAEFQLMNSSSARRVVAALEVIETTEDERRTLITWQREFDGVQQTARPFYKPRAGEVEAWRQSQLELWQRSRDLLGDDRFARLLETSNPLFDQMREATGEKVRASGTVALDFWFLWQNFLLTKAAEARVSRHDALREVTRAKAVTLVGEPGILTYERTEEGKWLRRPEVKIVRQLGASR